MHELEGLHLNTSTERTLAALAHLKRASAADVARYLNKPKSSVYDGLDELVNLGIATEESDETGRVFSLAKPEQMSQVKIRRLKLIETAFGAISEMNTGQESVVARPRVRFYTGVEGIRQAFRDMPWTARYKDSYLMWPMKEMLETLGEEFLKFHGSQRHTHGVMLHSVRKESDRKALSEKYQWLESDPLSQRREVRYAPKDADWSMSFWVYGNQTLFAGSGSEHFAFIVRSKEFADLMTLLWRQMWEQSEK